MRSFDEWVEEGYTEKERNDEVSFYKLFMVLAVCAAIVWAAIFSREGPGGNGNQTAYEVVSLHSGALHVVDRSTGEQLSLRDQTLIAQALRGDIRKGDVIYLD